MQIDLAGSCSHDFMADLSADMWLMISYSTIEYPIFIRCDGTSHEN